jgi:tetratricopeptide (TPR) repeat protein
MMIFYRKSGKAIALFSSISVAVNFWSGANSIAPVQAETPEQVQKIAREITVRIDGTIPGSGIIVARQGSTYYVATAKHVVKDADQYEILTYGGGKYPVKVTSIKRFAEVDLAVVTFVSDRNYQVATLSRYLEPTYERRSYRQGDVFSGLEANQQQAIFVTGFPNPVNEGDPLHRYVFNLGRILDTSGSTISNPSNRSEGYRLAYSNFTRVGMSGGAVLDTNGRVIAIHGRADGQKIIGDRVTSNTLPESNEEERIGFGSSLGIPITTFLTLLPNTGVQIDLKIENTAPSSISTSQLRSWIPDQLLGDRTKPVYWINLGNQLWRTGDLQRSQEALEKAISLKPDYWQAWFAKGFISGFNRQYDQALNNCETAIKFNSNSYNAWRCKAGALYQLGKPSEAIEALDRAIKINKDSRVNIPVSDLGNWRENPVDYTERGEILFALQRNTEAIASFDQAIALDPDMASAWSNRGFVQIANKDYAGAESSITRALAIDPNYAPAWANRGLLLTNLKQYLESVAAFDKAVQLNDRDPEIWSNRGVALYYSGQSDKAAQSIRKALEIDSNYAPAREALNAIQSSK